MTMDDRHLIFGNNRFAALIRFFLDHDSDWPVVGIIALDDESIEQLSVADDTPIYSLNTLRDSKESTQLARSAFVAVDSTASCSLRQRYFRTALDLGFRLSSFIHTRADVPADLKIGQNSLISDGAGVHPFVTIGDNSFIGAGSRIGFHSCIGDHCWLAGARLGESVTVGNGVSIGTNATIAPGLTIADGSQIGPGTLVTTSTTTNEIRCCSSAVASRVPSYRVRHLR